MEPLAALDSLMLAAEKLGSAMHVGVLLILSPPPDAAPEYVDAIYQESLTAPDDVDPRLRRFPYRGVDTGGVWVWRQAAHVDLHRHLHRTTLPSGSGPAELWNLVSELHSERLDLAAPLWASWLIDGFDDGRSGGAFALYIKVHHTLIDGVGGVQMIADTMSPDPDRRGMPPFYVDRHAPEPVEAEGSGHRFFRPLEGIRAITESATAALDLTRRVAAAELTNFIGGLSSDAVVGPLAAPRTRFNTRLGPRRAAAGTSLCRTGIGAIRQAAGVTTNDVITAVISGVLHQWLSQVGELPRRSLVAMCPVSVRPRDSSTSGTNGNRFGLGLCPLGTDLDDPAARLALIHDAMSRIKHQVAERGANATLAVMGPAIGSTVLLPLLPFGGVIPPSCNLAISNVPGPSEHIYYNGARLDDIYPVSSAFDGMGLNVTACCYADRVEIGYVTDAELMDDIAVLVPLTHAALADLATAVGISTP